MVFNSISFSIRFAPPRVALAFEQRHVRFVKIPITCLVVIILLLLHYVSGKCCAPRYYYSIIIVPARTHCRYICRTNVVVIIEVSMTTAAAEITNHRGRYRLWHRCRRARGGRRRENLTLYREAQRMSRGRFLRLPIHRCSDGTKEMKNRPNRY